MDMWQIKIKGKWVDATHWAAAQALDKGLFVRLV